MQNSVLVLKWYGLSWTTSHSFYFRKEMNENIFSSRHTQINARNSFLLTFTLVTGRVTKMLILTFVPKLYTQCQFWAIRTFSKLHPVNLFYPDTLINTNQALWMNSRIFKRLELWRHPRKVCTSFSYNPTAPFVLSVEWRQNSWVLALTHAIRIWNPGGFDLNHPLYHTVESTKFD